MSRRHNRNDSDVDDPTFNPNQTRASNASIAHTTPSTRAEISKRQTEATRTRVQAVDQNGGRCLIENVPKGPCVEYAHYFPRALTDDGELMSNIEWWWNMKHFTLNLDTRDNVFPFGASLHRLFDKKLWILLPEMHVIQQYYAKIRERAIPGTRRYDRTTERKEFPNIKRGYFIYNFLSLEDGMRGRAITRQKDPVDGYDPTTNDFTVHPWPFENVPQVRSHLHPKFVILESGLRVDAFLRQQGGDPVDRVEELRWGDPRFLLVQRLALVWTGTRPVNAPDDETYGDSLPKPDKDTDNVSESNTLPKRIGLRSDRPPNTEGDGSPPRQQKSQSGKSGKKRKAASVQLSGETLCQFDHLDKDAMIKSWVSESQARYHEMLDVSVF